MGPASTSASIDLFCPECGYNLRGIESDRCPECGHALDREKLARSSIPWAHRREIGRVKAYVRTVWLVIADPKRIADDVARPVSYDDARKFRRVTVLIAAATVWVALVWMYVASTQPIGGGSVSPLPPHVRLGWVLEWIGVAVTCLAMHLFLLAASGAVQWFFHPPYLPVVRQNRAVALSLYACAPLALTPISIGCIVPLAWVMGSMSVVRAAMLLPVALLWMVTLALPLAQAVSSYVSPLRMLRWATQCPAARLWTMGIALPAIWAMLAAVVAIGIPAAYVFISLVVLSLASS